MKNCKNCNHELNDIAMFCEKCGTNQESPPLNNTENIEPGDLAEKAATPKDHSVAPVQIKTVYAQSPAVLPRRAYGTGAFVCAIIILITCVINTFDAFTSIGLVGVLIANNYGIAGIVLIANLLLRFVYFVLSCMLVNETSKMHTTRVINRSRGKKIAKRMLIFVGLQSLLAFLYIVFGYQTNASDIVFVLISFTINFLLISTTLSRAKELDKQELRFKKSNKT